MSGDIEAACQLVQDALWRHIEVAEHDQRMKPQVGSLINQIIRLAGLGGILGGDEGLGALLPHLFQDLVQALVVETGDVGGLG